MRAILFVLCLFFSLSSAAQSYFEWNENCTAAYTKLSLFQFEAAKIRLQAEDKANKIPVLLENYTDFLRIVLDNDQADFENYEKRKNARIKSLNATADDPYRLFCQAEIHLHTAITRLIFQEYVSAFWDIRKAFKLYTQNSRKYPDFGPNKKGLGMLQIMLGSIPEKYRWGAKIAGLSGSIEEGAGLMKEFISESEAHPMQEEARMIYAFFELGINNNEAAAAKIAYNEIDPTKSMWGTMAVFILANQLGDNDQAIAAIEKCPRNEETHPFAAMDYFYGLFKLQRLDGDVAPLFQQYIAAKAGNAYKNDARQKLAWSALLNGNEADYQYYMQEIRANADQSDENDRSALAEARLNFIPNKSLLEARLLFDGGYYEKALQRLATFSLVNLTEQAEILEYTYRLGRIYQKMDETTKAIAYFDEIIAQESKNSSFYFAAKSVLEKAEILEGKKQYSEAKKLLQEVPLYTNHIYVDAFAREAKTALQRIKESGN